MSSEHRRGHGVERACGVDWVVAFAEGGNAFS